MIQGVPLYIGIVNRGSDDIISHVDIYSEEFIYFLLEVYQTWLIQFREIINLKRKFHLHFFKEELVFMFYDEKKNTWQNDQTSFL